MTTHLLDGARSAWVSEESSSKTFNDRPTLALDGTGANEKRAFIWFPNPVGRLGDSVTSAIMTVYLSNAWSGTTTITVSRVTASWRQSEVRWGASGGNPSVSTINQATATVTDQAADVAVPIDLTAMFSDVAAGSPWYGVRVEIDTDGVKRLHSHISATKTLRPKLVVEMVTAPDAPDGLVPNGTARALDETQPIFRWEYSSSDANAYQYESRVQVSSTESDYSDPAYDSGWVTNEQVSWDSSLDATSPPTLEDGTTYYWRVAVRDNNGQESDYSDEATFLYASLGDLQIVDPVQDDDAVGDNTPTITWYTDDREQRQVRIRVYAVVAGVDTLLYERPWQAQQQDDLGDGFPSGVDTWTIPSTIPARNGGGDPIISQASTDYAVEVAMRDEYARRDDEIVTDTRYFTFTPDGTVTAPTAVVASGTGPLVTLTWERASTPDEWVIVRDGLIVKQKDGDALLVSGTSYSWDDYEVKRGETYQYSVHAKSSGGGMSLATDASSTVTITTVGIWLLDEDTSRYVPILGQAAVPRTLDEIATSLQPLNRRDPVRVVARIGGYSGTVAGTLAAWNGQTVEAILADLEFIAGKRSTAKLRLVAGGMSIPVNIGNLTVSQDPTQGGTEALYEVSFNYWQVGNYSVEVN